MSRTMCAESEAVMYEFPILRNGEVFSKGMDPSTDRIIVGSIDNGDAPKVWSKNGKVVCNGDTFSSKAECRRAYCSRESGSPSSSTTPACLPDYLPAVFFSFSCCHRTGSPIFHTQWSYVLLTYASPIINALPTNSQCVKFYMIKDLICITHFILRYLKRYKK